MRRALGFLGFRDLGLGFRRTDNSRIAPVIYSTSGADPSSLDRTSGGFHLHAAQIQAIAPC